jgi:hypothetical protein
MIPYEAANASMHESKGQRKSEIENKHSAVFALSLNQAKLSGLQIP